ncbi:exodeoxyribonuclease VII small subunit [Insolitispirillum peregrinum]|uniref:Exodeoxyribonuclease 7 small subunit n=1 Tax=Insolitispirillum peregrinum TaxID=80876 RepID=A0A1N7LYT2_9PROT|nr:exodeoxyribonuclease VII small subunit [Insolitispirillum peregrinum]SIS78871.1 Exodeoxyribonuclease VII small subunit [Insolitispirillum peregrinum]
MAETPIAPDIAALSFEDALRELETIVRHLEGGQVRLDDAVDAYARGSQLKAHCERRLAEARAKIERITLSPDGQAQGVQPLDVA